MFTSSMREILDDVVTLKKRVATLERLIKPKKKGFITDEQKRQIIEFRKKNISLRGIAMAVGVSNSSVYRVVKEGESLIERTSC